MSQNGDLIERFYQAFHNKDHETMAQCYAPDAHFRDEVFELQGAEIGAMWRMLCIRGKDLALTYSVDDRAADVTAHWEATYTFSQTGRLVQNVIDAEFDFANGLISRHVDRFDFWRWSRQALGAPGLLLGWTPMLKQKVRATAAANLKSFMAQQPEKPPLDEA